MRDLVASEFATYQEVLAVHAEGSLEAEKLMLFRSYDAEPALDFVRRLAGLDVERGHDARTHDGRAAHGPGASCAAPKRCSGDVEMVSRRVRRGHPSILRYGDMIGARARRLAAALKRLGVGPGDRVATLAWNHTEHLEAYFAVPSMGAVLHTLNLRLHPDELAYHRSHADDHVVLVDGVLLPLFEQFRDRAPTSSTSIVMGGGGDRHGYARLRDAARKTPPTSRSNMAEHRRARRRCDVLHVGNDRAARRASCTRIERSCSRRMQLD